MIWGSITNSWATPTFRGVAAGALQGKIPFNMTT
jgi:hypothetical protein